MKYDLIVIGGGSGGLTSAAGAAGLGAKVALIEKHKLGGDCLNTGCVPSKALIRSAKIIGTMKDHQKYGIQKCDYEVSFSNIMDRMRAIQAKIEPHDSPERFQGLGVDVKFGKYSFKNPHELTDGKEVLVGKKIVISTGSSPVIPPIPGCKPEKCLTSDNIWNLRTLPKRFVVIGGGPIGSELAQCFARFGAKVTILDMGKTILPREDEDLRNYVIESFKKDEITMIHEMKLTHVLHGETEHVVSYTDKEGASHQIACDAILVAAGRRANIDGLELQKAGVEATPRGIGVNAYLQTSASHIYACGDVAGSYQFTHFADAQARLILRNALFPGKSKFEDRVVPWCTYTDPELSRVGLSETEAKVKNISHDVTCYDLKDLDRAVCDSQDSGKVKVVTQKGKDKILGAAIVGAHAGDILQEFVFAMNHGLGLKKISQTIHPYPTLVEAPRRAADTWLRSRLKPWMVKVLKVYFKIFFRSNQSSLSQAEIDALANEAKHKTRS